MKLEKPIIFFDLETTGTDTQKDRIVQIATLKLAVDGSIEEKELLINPECFIPEEASEVHGIYSKDVQDLPNFNRYAKNLNKYFEGCDIGGYNSNSFDIPLLVAEFERAGIDFDINNRNFIDVFKIESIVNSRKLSDTYKRYTGKDLEGAHDAGNDVRATLEILIEQIKKHSLSENTKELDEFSQGENKRVDISAKLVEIDGKICWNFGKNRGLPVKQDVGYALWFVKQSFPKDTIDIVKKEIN